MKKFQVGNLMVKNSKSEIAGKIGKKFKVGGLYFQSFPKFPQTTP